MLTYIRALACTSFFFQIRVLFNGTFTSLFLTNSLLVRLLSGGTKKAYNTNAVTYWIVYGLILKCVEPQSLFELTLHFLQHQHIRPVKCPAFRNGKQITFMRLFIQIREAEDNVLTKTSKIHLYHSKCKKCSFFHYFIF